LRDQIKSVAEDLLIRNGYRGTSFGLIAGKLKMTRANIHYHFGNKRLLVEEVLQDYVDATSEKLREIWTAPDIALIEKIDFMMEFSRKRHAKYNPPGKHGRPWSLIARMRQDSEFLTPKGRAALQRFGHDLTANIRIAIESAKEKKEFDASMPAEDVALQLVSIANSAGPITQDAGSFERLEQLYRGFARIISLAFATKRQRKHRVNSRKIARVGPVRKRPRSSLARSNA
jgi:TetR/AcrR family transcriptional regulator, transcriptional repressor for nem operon